MVINTHNPSYIIHPSNELKELLLEYKDIIKIINTAHYHTISSVAMYSLGIHISIVGAVHYGNVGVYTPQSFTLFNHRLYDTVNSTRFLL